MTEQCGTGACKGLAWHSMGRSVTCAANANNEDLSLAVVLAYLEAGLVRAEMQSPEGAQG